MAYIQTDVLIIGSGIAGCTAALQLADAGIDVTVITRAREPQHSNTLWAQGGIIYQGHEDSPTLLAEDLTHAGAGLSNPEAVRILAEEGPRLVRDILIEKVGVVFDKTSEGELSVALEAAHGMARIIHVADATGKAIEVALLNALKERPNIRLLTGHTAVDLLTPAHHSQNRLSIYEAQSCIGAYVLDQERERVIRIIAKTTVLATGGLGQIFLRTTNPVGSRGDGLAMAYRAGARVINAEFVQFHPTTFHKRNAPHFLISEAVRGAGARLVHGDGTPFMQQYAPEWKDLAARDVVARSIHWEMLAQDVQNVYLDLHSYIPRAGILDHFPSIGEQCWQYGIDITRDLVPVVPGAHYFCGGVWVDVWGRSTIERLYAVGEVACTGVHGANRLASSSLLEGLVWGNRAAQAIVCALPTLTMPDGKMIPEWRDDGLEEADPVLINHDMRSIQHMMWHYVGLVRTTPRLARALRELRHQETEIEAFYRVTRLTDGLIGLRNAVRTAVIVTAAAWSNKQSIGCHYRE